MANLNKRLEARHIANLRRGSMSIRLAFDPADIISTILRAIQLNTTHSVVGCIAWLSHPRILTQLATKPCSIVVTADRSNRKKHVRALYSKLKPADRSHPRAIKFLGARSGRVKTRMHHKFLVGLNSKGLPCWCISGSFNMSVNATKNIENVQWVRDEEYASVFFEEWKKVWNCC